MAIDFRDAIALGIKRMETEKANSRQVGGSHYKTGGLQHWDLVAMFEWDYFQGQITKYLMRWRKKNGIEDLEKARHYLDKYIEIQRSAREVEAKSRADIEHHADDARG